MKRLMTAATMLCAAAAFAFTEPIYTITTSGEGTNDITAATIEVTENGSTTTKSFPEISFTSGTILKRGTGFLRSDSSLVSFTGTVVVEEGAWLVVGAGQLGVSTYDLYANVVISNNASVVFDIPSNQPGRFYQRFNLRGTGYKGLGAIRVITPGSENSKFFWATAWTFEDDTTIYINNKTTTVGAGYQTLNLNRHTVTFAGFGDGVGDSSYYDQYPTISNPGNIVVDGIHFQYVVNDANMRHLTGAVTNTLTIHGTGKNESWLNMAGMQPTSPWTIKLGYGTIRGTYGTWDTTNVMAWAGPVELLSGQQPYISTTADKSFTFLNAVSGAGGFQGGSGQQISLVDGRNSFTGAISLNKTRSGTGELRVFWPGALPAANAGAMLYDSRVKLMYSKTYDLPPLTFDIASGKTGALTGGTNGTVRSLKKLGVGLLDMTSPLTVTGVTELAGGTLRLPCDRAGMTLGWRVQEGDANVGINSLSDIFTNRVELGTDLAYSDDREEWQRNDSNTKRLFTYHGYIWNRTDAPQNWTFAVQVVQGAVIFFDGVKQLWTDLNNNSLDYWDFYSKQKVGFATVNNVQPGCHQIDVRFYTTSGAIGYGTVANRRGSVSALTNATWQADLGFAIDRQGRNSTNYTDYERLVDPGDGSVLTVVPEGAENVEGVIAHMPKFDHLKFTGGTLDIRGSDITVPILEGVNGVVTNSNAYFQNGSLTVGQKWMLSGSAMANKTLKVYGKMKFAAGAALDCTDLVLLSRTADHTFATATGGIEGLPAFDGNANKGWHLVKTAANGAESLKLFWQLGSMLTIR